MKGKNRCFFLALPVMFIIACVLFYHPRNKIEICICHTVVNNDYNPLFALCGYDESIFSNNSQFRPGEKIIPFFSVILIKNISNNPVNVESFYFGSKDFSLYLEFVDNNGKKEIVRRKYAHPKMTAFKQNDVITSKSTIFIPIVWTSGYWDVDDSNILLYVKNKKVRACFSYEGVVYKSNFVDANLLCKAKNDGMEDNRNSPVP